MTAAVIDLRAAAQAHAVTLELATLGAGELAAIEATWRGRMINEYVSARVFAALVPQLMAAGAAPATVAEAVAMAGEELRHGALCAAVVAACGGDARAPLPTLAEVPAHAEVDPLDALLRNVLSISCLAETVAVALLGAERDHAGPAPLRDALTTIWSDEVGHARFGWRLLDEVAGELTAARRARLSRYLVPAFRHLRDYELANLPIGAMPSSAARALGVCDGRDARALFLATVTEVIVPGLEAHGLAAAHAWAAAA